MAVESEIIDAEWSEYFNGLNEAAVVYDASDRRYAIYNRDLALTRRSPCSAFKIISSLFALENEILSLEYSEETQNGLKQVMLVSDGNLYFCVYLGRTDGMNISSHWQRKWRSS